MGRGNEVDVMATHLLESYHGLCHVRSGDLLTISKMADVVILAESASEVTVGEEDRPRTVISNQGGFFTKMGKGTRDLEF